MAEPMVLRSSGLCMQVCVPKAWNDKQVNEFAESENPCGTSNGWFIRKQDDDRLSGCDERTQCADHDDMCHIMLDA